MLLVDGTRRPATIDEALRTINKIRWRACQQQEYYPDMSSGACYSDRHLSLATDKDVTDPSDEQLSKKNGDYVPLVWNDECEKVSEVRVAELVLSMVHARVNSDHLEVVDYTMQFNTSHQYIENISRFGSTGGSQFSTDEGAVEGSIHFFESERSDYLSYGDKAKAGESTDGVDDTGHYSQMINPAFKSVGIVGFLTVEKRIRIFGTGIMRLWNFHGLFQMVQIKEEILKAQFYKKLNAMRKKSLL